MIKRTIELFNHISKNKEEFKVFYEQAPKNTKLGIQKDLENPIKLGKLRKFNLVEELASFIFTFFV
jgi:molecular chaperone HtpG